MTQETLFIAGDWGTSNLRLYLCESLGQNKSRIKDTRYGPGINQSNSDFEETFFNLTEDWLTQYGKLPVLLSGMIGSSIGWHEAPYLNCPVGPDEIAAGRIQFAARGLDFSILAGLKAQNPLGINDVMRGEELQMLGWLQQQDAPPEQQLFALPGTHNKWTLTRNGQIETFLTAFSGELFGLLRDHSILIQQQDSFGFNSAAFEQGIDAVHGLNGAQLVHLLFSTRSKQVLGEMANTDALSYLSGLIIATDVIGAINLFEDIDSVVVIGEPNMSAHYQLVLEHLDIDCILCEPDDIAIAGYGRVYSSMSNSA